MEKIINIGIIGLGFVGERMINAALINPRANIVSIYDIDSQRLFEIADKYELKAAASQNEMLNDDKIDIIYLAVPPKDHYPIALDIFKSGKHFICEKPLANSMEGAKAMYDLSKENNVLCAMSFPTIYSKSYGRLVELLNEGFIGDLVKIEFQAYFIQWPRYWQQNSWIGTKVQGGMVREIVTHYVQLIQRLFGEIENIHSFVEYCDDDSLSETSIIAKADVGGIPILINAVAGIGSKEDLSLRIYGSKGVIYLKDWNQLWISNENLDMERIEISETNVLSGLLDNVFKALDGEESNIIDFYEGYKTHTVIEKLLCD